MASRLPPLPDGLDGKHFNRASFDRGIEVFSTLLLQIGIMAQDLKPGDSAHEKFLDIMAKHVGEMPVTDAVELLRMLDLVKCFHWDRLQAILVLKLVGAI